MNIPNILTIFRILLVPIYLILFYSANKNRIIYGAIVFILAGISDFLDGHIARKYDLKTKLGAALDPLADKLMTFAVLISFTTEGLIPFWVLLIMGAKEGLMIIGGFMLYLLKDKKVLPSNKYGKIATFSFYVAILSIVFKFPDPNITKILILVTVVLNMLAFINYLIIFLSKDSKNYI
ncbi:CDP-diacylglycerol--glycerol-3-phosphate 3-phosphatidyltransferase [Tepidimicrobium xylanilyticum]|uniref:CDP-diacylglycerol--glycerol-3-phosphate 3-phosphatidyltransferase n=1 Tax=Tepidimicrobium xylanilyticum TaxID=1123352 RepID=A0A1H3BCW6_9FIRM|nr:CDP-diacylglycerol--glycerol-3-phosphate 3-phosphatidyltransferase [Tepidimicrobium xylanilyticum]GMG96933.1 CDP-diacylglycerol--glycerol-3-phosphate 3-phosphatidyltransferase [Tepidimicrobium xylanilyticum]SDX39793.1 CDP-diacylglycerol--glycerol-3-phosphate 3-phosphatidyltransferase [Tepidimicrobium xylanilyticum]